MKPFESLTFPRFLIIALSLSTVLPARAATITWTNVSGSNWNSAANWTPNQVPGGSDTAVFSTPGTYTVDISDNESVNILTLGATSGTATLSISGGTFTVNGPGTDSAQTALAISGGTLTGPGSIVLGGQLSWTGGDIYAAVQCAGGSVNVTVFSTLGYGGQLINTGPLTWIPNSGPRTGGNSSAPFQTVISNAATGVINVTLNGNNIDDYAYGGATAFYNAGLINVSGVGQAGSITEPFINTGTVTISNGVLGVSDGGTNSGTITVDSGGTFNPNGGTFTSGTTISGTGSLAVSGGTSDLGGSINLSGAWTFSGGTANLTGSSAVISAAITNNGGTANFNGTGPWQTGTVAISGGTLAGAAPLVANGPLYWTGGNIYGLLQCAGGSVNVPVFSTLGYGGQLINTGPMTWTPNSGPRTGGNSSSPFQTIISNAASGIISITLNGNNIDDYAYGGAVMFYNAGQINVSGAGQAGSITEPFINTGTVTISNGVLGVSDGGTNSGTITVDSGGTFNPNGGTFTSGTTISGTGSLAVSGGTSDLGGSINLSGAWTFSGGTANLTGSSAVISTAITNNGGTANFNGTGPWQTGTVAISGGTLAGAAPLVASGPLYWTGGNIYGLLQCAGGSVNVPVFSTLGYGGQLINTGPMTWTPNSGPRTGGNSSSPFQTIISNAASGIISITLNGNNIDDYAYGGAVVFYNAGQINVSGAGQAGSITEPFINTGTITISTGILGVSDGGTNSGTITVGSAGTFNPNGGTFTSGTTISGAGSLAVSGGTANLGGSINLSGPWTFSGGTANLTGSSTIISTAITNNGGTANFNGAGPWQTGTVAISGGTFAGAAPLVSSGPLYWTGGNIYCVLQCAGGSVNVPVFSTLGYSGQLINTGPMAWTPNSGPRTGGNSRAPFQTVISNAATGVINVTLNGNNIEDYAYGGATAFYNAGLINVSGAGQNGAITDPFINTGTLNVQSGALSAIGGYTSTNGTLNFGVSSPTSFGTLALSGEFAINGTLGAISSGYAPKPGDSFPLITYGSDNGIFNAFNLPPDANWEIEYGPTVFSITVSNLTGPYVTLQAITPSLVPDAFTLLLLGPIGSNYMLQASTDSTRTNWVTVTNFTTVDTSFYYTDTTASNYPVRIYRAVMSGQ